MRPILFSILCLLYTDIAIAQPKWNIYLGDDQDSSLFEKSNIIRNISGDYSFFEFAGYHTYRNELINTSSGQNIDRLGVVLPAKTTDTYNMNAEAVWGKDDDTCLIVYTSKVDKVTHGRSALLSIVNLISAFSGSGTTPQSAPYSEAEHVKVSGTIYPGNLPFDYSFDKGNFDTYKLAGRIIINQDTLRIEAANHFINRRGRVKKFKLSLPSGIILKGKAGIYAAIDKYNTPEVFYIFRQLKEEEKLSLAAYMFIIGCFQQ